MKKYELEQKLIERSVSPYSYSLSGGLPNEAFCLNNNGDIWEIYYSEKGLKTSLKIYTNEDDACQYFYDLITKQ